LRHESTLIGTVTAIAQAASALRHTVDAGDSAPRNGGAVSPAMAQAVAAMRPHPLADDHR